MSEQVGEDFDAVEEVQVREPEEPTHASEPVETPEELLDRILTRLDRLENRIFSRDKANDPWSITNEIHYGNDVVLAELRALRDQVEAGKKAGESK